MATYDLYEVQASSLDEAKGILEAILGARFEERESSYHRGPYLVVGRTGEENFEVKINMDPLEDVPNEDEFPDTRFLLYVNNTGRSEALQAEFARSGKKVLLLRHEEL